ncbi:MULTISPECIES: acyl-CoA dehydrogenase [Achromobacter]|uniref:Acyl-coenzyme A dehydrogenase n=1 Tax=Achromobacter spanius TaxID=217203 RepID=A0ABY8H0J0_9BURK|nr:MULTISPECIES: acyl-CoA dehydrogenase [Achromobacter]WAI85946.1 acyl-CoA dehydrogenase [Achromobacter spanius]WEX96027.1 acyl-CoA dehydrogenase [Achromobacter sp. SS2-2022]WFP10254.1 acyl-CoA dehydrogenase [Achromobacter spanius]
MNAVILTLIVIVALAAIVLSVRPLRRALLSAPIFNLYRKVLPQMSDTERDALEAGTVWWEGELFRGRPDWSRLLAYPRPRLTDEEQHFLDNQAETACRMVNDWSVTHEHHDLPAELWTYLKTQGFLGMIIPKEYGGLAFSAYAHSEIVTKLSTRSSALAVSVMVPNSLGPAELLLHYGTDEQKNHYLPRLARGEDVPAFALTSPWAGSDAAAIPDSGIVCKGEWQGREVLGMRVTWDKRYITLAPVCTLLGLAFRLYDPDGLLGGKKDLGITCALVPHDHPGVDTGRRHFPLNAMFMNGPTRGTDVFMPLDFIIGGPAMAGQGWRMLMECLAAGRSISLPSSNTGMSKLTARAVGGYARVRSQFRMPVGKFEGVEEALARIGGHTYMMDAARSMTAGAVDLGEKPSVVSAIVKYHVTERARQVVNDGMDVIGGKGICLGPNNFLGRAYQQIPIGITVEGANILTRSLIIFGQGAIRCHPYVLAEMQAAQSPDAKQGLTDFDAAFWGHVGFVAKNKLRTLGTALTGARWVKVNADVAPDMKRYYQLLSRYSAAFALLADTSMLVLGGSLKRRERLSARLGDVLSQMYLISATLKRFEDEGRQAADAPLAHWSIQDALFKLQEAFNGVLDNFPNRFVAWSMARLIFPWGRTQAQPSDLLGQDVARLLINPGATRDRLTSGCHLPATADEPVGAIEQALAATLEAEPIDAKIRELEKRGTLEDNPQANVRDIADAAYAAGGITAEEYAVVKRRNVLRDTVVKVDDFPFDLGASQASRPDVERKVA